MRETRREPFRCLAAEGSGHTSSTRPALEVLGEFGRQGWGREGVGGREEMCGGQIPQASAFALGETGDLWTALSRGGA